MRKKSWYAHTQVDGTIRFFVQRSLDTSPEYQGIKTYRLGVGIRNVPLDTSPEYQGIKTY